MINDITFSVEDVQSTYHADRPSHPVLCDECREANNYSPNKHINWKCFHALKNSPYSYQEVDYYRACNIPCTCCWSTKYDARWLVVPVRRR